MTYKIIELQKDLKAAGYDVRPSDPSMFKMPGIMSGRDDRVITDDEAEMIAQRFTDAMREDLCETIHDEFGLSMKRLRDLANDRTLKLRDRIVAVSYVAGYVYQMAHQQNAAAVNGPVNSEFLVFVGELAIIMSSLSDEAIEEMERRGSETENGAENA